MYCPKDLRINQHRVVDIPDGKTLFGRVGTPTYGAELYTGDEVAPERQNCKANELAETDARLYAEYAEEMSKQNKDDE